MLQCGQAQEADAFDGMKVLTEMLVTSPLLRTREATKNNVAGVA